MGGNNWTNTTLGTICDVNPESVEDSYPHGEIEYVDISSVGTGVLISVPSLLPFAQAPSRAKRLIRSGDTIVSTVRPNRRSFLYMKSPSPNTVASTGFAVLRPKDNVDGRFLYYLIADPSFTDYLVANTKGSAYPAVTADVFKDAKVSIPSLKEQRRIAHILGTLDDKIELNRRMNATLEAIAQAIFKSWFVDFDPVRAKSLSRASRSQRRRGTAGRPSGLPGELDALFPDSFENSEMGEIPKGWEVTDLGDVIDIYDSKRIPLSSRQRAKRPGPYPYYGASSIMDYVDDYIFDGVYMLIGEDGSVINDFGFPVTQYVWGKFWVNNHAHVIQGRGSTSTETLLLWMRQTPIIAYVTGAVQPKLNQANLKSIPIIRPPDSVTGTFDKIISPLFSNIRRNTEEITTLSAMRDLTLPNLMKGNLVSEK